ncbi:O-antigen ligase family protein [Pseudocitrobacter faecalis]|nr:O-antigen ligase family protein [Pseudocitrobacter faecalis]
MWCSVYFRSIKNKVIKVIFLFIFAFLIYRSETRLALVVFLMIIGFYSFRHITLYFRRAVALSVICVFSLSYLVYSFIIKYSDIFSMRYGAGEDKSYEARTLIQSHVLDDWQNSSFVQYIFGHGAEAARNMLIDIYGFDIMPHNDFLKLLYDFGILGFIVFIVACLYSLVE